MRASIMRDVHREQRGRSMGVRDGREEKEARGMTLFREFFPRGLTALDDLDKATLGTHPGIDHVTAREEVTNLLCQLKLPIDERGRRRAANRAEWYNQVNKPLEVHDIFGAPQIGFQTPAPSSPQSVSGASR
jgi:hypothetical protein